jgi:hypothetical protein
VLEQGLSRAACIRRDHAEVPPAEVELEPCEKIDWHNLSENYYPPLNMPCAQEGQYCPVSVTRMLSMEFWNRCHEADTFQVCVENRDFVEKNRQ